MPDPGKFLRLYSIKDNGGKTMGLFKKAKDKAQVVEGEVKDKAGEATNDRSLQAEGKSDKVAGNLKQAGENVKDALDQS